MPPLPKPTLKPAKNFYPKNPSTTFIPSSIPGVGTDSASGQIMSKNRYDSHPQNLQRVQFKQNIGGTTGDVDVMGGGANPGIKSFKKGGPVKKTGIYKLHKGEYVLNKMKAMAHKMSPNDSDNLREFSRRDATGKDFYRMPEGTYKRKGDRYEREESKGQSVIHG